jgi:hypothetical protein
VQGLCCRVELLVCVIRVGATMGMRCDNHLRPRERLFEAGAISASILGLVFSALVTLPMHQSAQHNHNQFLIVLKFVRCSSITCTLSRLLLKKASLERLVQSRRTLGRTVVISVHLRMIIHNLFYICDKRLQSLKSKR